MPRYLFETSPPGQLRPEDGERVAAQRFPELTVEQRCPAPSDDIGRDRWLCRAPSETHVRRWAAAVGVTIQGLRRIDADEPSALS